jgi:hypothetical protein
MGSRIERIKELRPVHGLYEAKRIERAEWLRQSIADAKTVDDLKPILLELAGEVAWKG